MVLPALPGLAGGVCLGSTVSVPDQANPMVYHSVLVSEAMVLKKQQFAACNPARATAQSPTSRKLTQFSISPSRVKTVHIVAGGNELICSRDHLVLGIPQGKHAPKWLKAAHLTTEDRLAVPGVQSVFPLGHPSAVRVAPGTKRSRSSLVTSLHRAAHNRRPAPPSQQFSVLPLQIAYKNLLLLAEKLRAHPLLRPDELARRWVVFLAARGVLPLFPSARTNAIYRFLGATMGRLSFCGFSAEPPFAPCAAVFVDSRNLGRSLLTEARAVRLGVPQLCTLPGWFCLVLPGLLTLALASCGCLTEPKGCFDVPFHIVARAPISVVAAFLSGFLSARPLLPLKPPRTISPVVVRCPSTATPQRLVTLLKRAGLHFRLERVQHGGLPLLRMVPDSVFALEWLMRYVSLPYSPFLQRAFPWMSCAAFYPQWLCLRVQGVPMPLVWRKLREADSRHIPLSKIMLDNPGLAAADAQATLARGPAFALLWRRLATGLGHPLERPARTFIKMDFAGAQTVLKQISLETPDSPVTLSALPPIDPAEASGARLVEESERHLTAKLREALPPLEAPFPVPQERHRAFLSATRPHPLADVRGAMCTVAPVVSWVPVSEVRAASRRFVAQFSVATSSRLGGLVTSGFVTRCAASK